MSFSKRRLAILAAMPALAFSASAFATDQVSVSAYSRAGHAGGASCQYNGNSVNGCSGVGDPSSTGSLSTSGGTADAPTHASASTYQTGTDYGQTQPEATSIGVTSDLATASLHLASTNSNGSPSSGYGSGGSAGFSDVLHFQVAGASADTITPVTVSFAIDGTMAASAANAPSTGAGEFYGSMSFGSSDARFYFLDDASTAYATTGSFDTYPSAYPGIWTHAADYSSAYYTETYDIMGAAQDIAVAMHANLNCSNGASCQYGNTAKLGIMAPAGTSFTSDSGVFLTGSSAAGAVPEPAVWMMMIVGFGAVGTVMRRRHPVTARVAQPG